MNTKEKTALTKNKKSSLSIALYVGGAIVALLGLALLITNVKLYSDTINQYVAMGYDASEVTTQLLPSQLLPTIFQAIALYGGVSMILFCLGLAYQKFTNFTLQFATEEAAVEASETVVSELEETAAIEEALLTDTVDEESTETAADEAVTVAEEAVK
jgi:hypothetical protein